MKLTAKQFFELYRLQDENKQLHIVDNGGFYTVGFIYNNDTVQLSSTRRERKRFKTLDAVYKEITRHNCQHRNIKIVG